MSGKAIALLALGLTAGAVACEDDVPLDPPVIDTVLLTQLDVGVHTILSVQEISPDGSSAKLRLHLVPVDVQGDVASVQGEFQWDLRSVTLRSASIPGGIFGAHNETEAGVLRFAGVRATGLRGEPVLDLEVDLQAPLSADLFSVRIEEMISTEGFVDLLPDLVEVPNLVLTREVIGLGSRR